jgi:hypothetical protein
MKTSNVQERSLLHLCFLHAIGIHISCCSRDFSLHLRFFWKWQAVDLFAICHLLGTTGGGGRSGGSTTLGTHSLAPVANISISYLCYSRLKLATYMKVLEKKEIPIIKAQLGMMEKP